MPKIGVDAVALIGHSGKDTHSEANRLTTLAIEKETKTQAVPHGEWPFGSDHPADLLLQGSAPLTPFEATGWDSDPDDAAPWSWNCKGSLFKGVGNSLVCSYEPPNKV